MTASRETRGDWGGRVSPGDVHDVLFTRAGLGRRGYEEAEVDVFLERIQQEITRLIAEKADLRDEVARLKARLTSTAAAEPGILSKGEANLQAVRLLAAAQQTADVYVADAEKYSQRVTADARDHSEQVLEEARQAAQQMVDQAQRHAHEAAQRTVEGGSPGAAEPSALELDAQIIYLKTFSQVCRVQLRAYLEALLRDVEEEWGRADPRAVRTEPVAIGPAPELDARRLAALPASEPVPARPGRGGRAVPADRASKDAADPATMSTSAPAAPSEAGSIELDTAADESPEDDRPPRRRSGTVSHSR